MGRFVNYTPCPLCRSRGKDKAGDNLANYDDGSAHCFSCGYHVPPSYFVSRQTPKEESHGTKVLPIDFQREVPSEGWKWLLQYGLPYSYWKEYTGYTEKYNRLVFTYGTPIRFSIGRALSDTDRKWMFWGEGHSYVEVLNPAANTPIVLVEDIVSNHVVAQVASSICLFGTNIHDVAIKELQKWKKPVILWLDRDQWEYLPKKVGKLSSLLNVPVTVVSTRHDPKSYSIKEIQGILKCN